MKSGKYFPQRGDIVYINLDPTKGHEQSGVRPAIVLSNSNYNKITGLFIVCPITSKVKGYPFEVEVKCTKISGVVLSDQIKCLDWTQRNISFVCKVNESLLGEILENLSEILEIGNK